MKSAEIGYLKRLNKASSFFANNTKIIMKTMKGVISMKKGIVEFAKQNPITTGIVSIIAIGAIDNIVVNICKAVSYRAQVKAIAEIETTETSNQKNES